ncbi:radical SAM protein [Bacteroidia bacterium]|nr:radical SAM protein [Bacteroidia bacterium]
MITTVNYHLTKACNFKCKYCYAQFKDIHEEGLPKAKQFEVVRQLAESGKFRKINFAGGEPTLVPHITELIQYAKSLGLETSIVTNTSQIDFEWVKNISSYLDILAISIDSLNLETNIKIGSNQSGKILSINNLRNISTACQCFGVQLKINTVVSKFNHTEKLTDFVNEMQPFRWKILQATEVKGQNDCNFEEVAVSTDDFLYFCSRNSKGLLPEIKVVKESNELIKGSYIMVDCLGRFFDSSQSCHNYSAPILEVGVKNALNQINVDSQKFIARNGNYSTIKENIVCTF